MGMMLSKLKRGDMVKSRFHLSPARAKAWRYAGTNADIGGGIAVNAMLKVVEVSMAPPWAKLELPGRHPPSFITLSGEEMASLFDMGPTGVAPSAVPQKPQNLMTVFQKLSQKQTAAREGMHALREARRVLAQDMHNARFWGNVAVFANAALLPLNVMINAFEAKAAVTAYQAVVKELYSQFAKSGTRMQGGAVKTSLSIIKKATVEALKSKGLTSYVPGVNILVGFAEDSVALFETASMVHDGSNEMRTLMRQMESKIAAAEQAYLKIGIEMDRILTEMQTRARTA